ncbi:MAG TPA: filamentous hemagglutinin N-terminal domain-containing protein, partial [Allocoleopsis sp.]
MGLSVPGVAQVIPDETLGEERSTVTRQTIRGIDSDRIDGGARRGQNLFHSFQQFDVLEGRGAYFSNPAEVRNIFSRVTGADPSEIMGRLGVLGEANLFFMNPNGILFGPNASLDVAGSFVGTTANAIQFGEQGFFSATNPETPSPLLAIDPGVLFFNQLDQQTGTISNSGNLAVGRDFTLSADMLDLQGQLFAGGNLTLQGLDTVRIRDSFTNPFIAASGEKLLVQGDRVVDIFALNHPNSGLVSGGDMVLRSSNQVGGDAHYWSGGNFRIERLDGSLGNLFSPYDPVIRIAGDLELGSYLGASLHILAGGSVTIPGFIGILGSDTTGAALTETVTLSNGTTLAIDGTSRPTVDIRAGVSPEAIGIPLGLIGDGLFPITGTVSDNATSADISVGYIGMFAPDGVVYLTNQYQPNRSLPSGTITLNGDGLPSQPDPIRGIRSLNDTGNGTSVIIDSRSNIDIPNSISTSSIGGNSGDVTLLADENISFTENGSLNVNTPNIGNAGNISIDAVGLVSLSGSNTGILSNVDRTGSGQGGNIAIRAGSLALSDGTLIDASTFGNGNAGRIVIDVGHGAVTLDSGSLIFNKIEENAIGDTGGIEIRAGSLSLSGASRIAVANSGGNGRLGNLLIDATDSISVTDINLDPVNQVIGSLITNRLEPGSSGIGGDVIISTGSLSLVGSQISASTFGTGDSGQVLITAGDSVSLTNNSAVFSSDESSASGDAGGIHIDANSLSINESSILALVRGEATEPSNQGRNGADVTINLRGDLEIISNRDSSVFDGIATAIAPGATGNAGDIRISARDIALTGSTSQLRSSLDLGTAGTAGNINIQARSLRILDKAAITTATLGSGNAGDISIQVEDLISLSTNSTIESGVLRGGNGNSGSIHLEAGRLSVTQGADISTKVGGIGLDVAEGMTMPLPPAQGNAGNINITVRGSAIFDGVNFTTSPNGTIGVEIPSGIASDVISESGGTGGDIALRASSLLLNNGAQFNSQTSGTGQAGDITIIADQVTVLNGSGIEATTTGSADAGSIRVDTNQLVVRDGSYFLADALEGSTGQAGTLTVNAIDSIEIVGIAP